MVCVSNDDGDERAQAAPAQAKRAQGGEKEEEETAGEGDSGEQGCAQEEPQSIRSAVCHAHGPHLPPVSSPHRAYGEYSNCPGDRHRIRRMLAEPRVPVLGSVIIVDVLPVSLCAPLSGQVLCVFSRTQDLKTKKHHIPLVDRTPLEPPPIVVVVVGPPRVGKSTIIRCLIKNYTRQKLGDISGPVTIVSGGDIWFSAAPTPPPSVTLALVSFGL